MYKMSKKSDCALVAVFLLSLNNNCLIPGMDWTELDLVFGTWEMDEETTSKEFH